MLKTRYAMRNAPGNRVVQDVTEYGLDLVGAGLRSETREHRLGCIHPRNRNTARGQRHGDPPCPDRELDRTPVARELRQEVHNRPDNGRVGGLALVITSGDVLAEVLAHASTFSYGRARYGLTENAGFVEKLDDEALVWPLRGQAGTGDDVQMRTVTLIEASTSAGAYAPGQEDGARVLLRAGLVERLQAVGVAVRFGRSRHCSSGPRSAPTLETTASPGPVATAGLRRTGGGTVRFFV